MFKKQLDNAHSQDKDLIAQQKRELQRQKDNFKTRYSNKIYQYLHSPTLAEHIENLDNELAPAPHPTMSC